MHGGRDACINACMDGRTDEMNRSITNQYIKKYTITTRIQGITKAAAGNGGLPEIGFES